MKPKIKEKLFHNKPNYPDKLFCNICDSSFVGYSSNTNLRKHFTKYHKKELDEFDINDISSELTRLEESVLTFDEEVNDVNPISNIIRKNNNFKGLMEGFEGQGEIDIVNGKIKFKGKFNYNK
ncbi:4138_t:CDS:1 [Scutellospora calospora]|uniref:4138_t:CDS:1 n=1 Tax=Scutellospora calospora TaxID=85575 RepID=A0ACA9NML3_9GLOM|nr:4138_t:CDS:1 [Scutellospora calospora]